MSYLKRTYLPILVWVGLNAISACATQEEPVRAEPAYDAFKLLAGATSVGVNKQKDDELLQQAAAVLLRLNDLVAGTRDTLPLVRYATALSIYHDAGKLWAEQVSGRQYDFIPTGRIFASPEVFVLAERYHLPVDTVKTTFGSRFSTIPDSAIQVLWAQAEAAAIRGDSLVVPRLRARGN